jgi:predicted HTH transcriptional regulator
MSDPMDRQEVLELIEEGEGFHVEFKRLVPSPEKIAKSMIAFANTKGGCILFGVDDDGSIVGVESEKTEAELLQLAGSRYCEPAITPTIEIVPFDGRDVIIARVRESTEKPHRYLDDNKNGREAKVYIRVNDKSVLASKEVIKILQDERIDGRPLEVSIGENEHRLFRYLEKEERISLKQFCHLVNISERRASQILVKLVRAGVIRLHTLEKEDYYTLAYDVDGRRS